MTRILRIPSILIIIISFLSALSFVSGQTPVLPEKEQGGLPFSEKQRIRSEWFFNDRSDQDGSMRSYTRAMQRFNAEQATRSDPQNITYAQWYPLGPSEVKHPVLAQLGQIYSLWVDTTDYQTIYAGSNTGGAWVTRDGGNNWTSMTGDLFTTGVLSIQVNPKDNNHIFLGTGYWSFGRSYGTGLLESKDGGVTWSQNSLNNDIISNQFVVQKHRIHPASPDTMLAVLNTEFNIKGVVLQSTDGGMSWQNVYEAPKAMLFAINHQPGNPNRVYISGDRLLRSDDAGASWNDLTYTLPFDTNFMPLRLQVAFTEKNPDLMMVYCETHDTTATIPGPRKYLFRSFDGGETFHRLLMKHEPLAGYWKMQFAISPSSNNEFYLGGVWLFKYRIEGDSAKYIYSSDHKYHVDVRDLHIFQGDTADIMFMANDGGVSRSDNGGEYWYDITRNGMQILQLHNINTGENTDMMYGGPQDANLSFYNFKTKEWSRNNKVSDAYEGAVDYNDPKIVYLVGVPPKMNQPNMFLKKSVDGGLTFAVKGISDTTEIGRWDKPMEMDPVDPNIIYIGVRNVWKSVDGAETFTRISDFPGLNDPKLKVIKVAPSNRNVIYAAFENPDWAQPNQPKLFVTPDGGSRWINITPSGPSINLNYAGIGDIAIDPQNPQRIWLAMVNTWHDRRCYRSEDGGLSWHNFSEGLPDLPVNKIKFVKGAGYDVLLAATDGGVYYRDARMNEWVPFGTGLPKTLIADLEISYSRNKIIAGTFGRGLWEAELCLPLEDEALVISDNQSWITDRNVLQDLIIEPGAKLTLKSHIEMGRGRQIIVKPGGSFRMEGGSINSNCADLWKGIKVYGKAGSEDASDHGSVFLGFGAALRNAITAIETFAVDDNGEIIAHQGGGIIEARNAVFQNNRTTVILKPNPAGHLSGFKLCRFSSTDYLTDGSLPGDFVVMEGIHGISFLSCQFENNLPASVQPQYQRGAGIRSFNSSFIVDRFSTDSIPFGLNSEPVFRLLSAGIYAASSLPGNFVSVKNAKFDRNLSNIYFAGTGLAEVSGSDFKMGTTNTPDSIKPVTSGIYLDQTTRFLITGNIFTGPVSSIMPQSKSAGIVVNQSGDKNNIISGNTIRNLNYALLLQNNNRSQTGGSGLRILNNWFASNEYDITITTNQPADNPGIALHQGAPAHEMLEAAGNHFSYGKWRRDGDIHNEGKRFFYFHEIPAEGLNQKPANAFGIEQVQSSGHWVTDSTYLPEFIRAYQHSPEETLTVLGIQAQNLHSTLQANTDGGNTLSLLSDISSSNGYNAPEIHARVMKSASFLSDTALLELAKNYYYPDHMLAEVFSANPQFFRNKALVEALNQREPEMPAYMLVEISKHFKEYSEKELAEAKLSYTEAALNHLVTTKLATSGHSVAGKQGILAMAANAGEEEDYESAVLAISAYGLLGDSLKTTQLLTRLSNEFPAKANETEKLASLLAMHDKYFGSGNEARPVSNADSLMMINLTKEKSRGVSARNMLIYKDMISYREPYILPGPMIPDTVPALPPVVFTETGFSIMPVPAREYVIADYFTDKAFSSAVITIHSVTGKFIRNIPLDGPYGRKLISIHDLKPGVYIFSYSVNNEQINKQKVLVSH